MMSTDVKSMRLIVRAAIPACLLLAVALVALAYALPALAQESDPDGTRDGAVSLGGAVPGAGTAVPL